ncbi:MAG: InlB B-repeat-containing protein, partial [Dehalococcoidales bacterium]|nr:InlB B-repeat-containing protein [Dehalococcoidales bacterium]
MTTVSAQAGPFNLTIVAENGAVMLDPATGPYEAGSIVELTAIPDDGYHLVNWSGSENIADPEAAETTVTMLEDTTVTANFEINTYTLTVDAEHGSVSRDPDQATYNHGEIVTLTPIPDEGYHFIEWGGDASGSDNILHIFMDSDKTVTANFSGTCILEIAAGTGGIVTAPASPYIADYMEEVNLTAVASPGYHFLNWTGADNIIDATAATTVVIMDNDKTIKANFIKYNEDIINYGYTSFGQYQVLDIALPVSSFEDWNQVRGSFEADEGVYRTDPTTTPVFSLAVPGIPVEGQGYIYQAEFRRLGEIDCEGYTILYFNEKHHGSQVESLCLFIGQAGQIQLVSFEENVTGPILASTSMLKDNDWHTASIVNYGNMIEVYIDGQLKLFYKGDLNVYSRSGSIGVGSEGFHSEFRNIKVTELDYWLVSHLDIQKRFFYEPEPVNISFLVDSADYPLDATLKVIAPDLSEFSCNVLLPPQSQQHFQLEYPADFNGADLAEKGRYKISMVTPAGEIVIPDATFEYKDEPLLSFVVGTDTHVLPNLNYSKPFTSFVTSVNDQTYFPTPDMVVLTGDNADDVRGLYKFKDIFDTLYAPHYTIVAGHDHIGEAPGYRGQTYYELFGDTYCFAVEREGYIFILTGAECDYSALTQGLGESLSNPSMLNWLDTVLQENAGRPAFVFHHQTPAQFRDEGYADYFWMGHGNGSIVRNFLESHGNVLAYFSGHNHIVGTKIINGIAYVGAGAVFNLPSAYRYIEVYSDQVAVHTIKFGIGQEKWYEYWYPGCDSTHTPDNYVYGSPAERDFKINTSTRILTTAVAGGGSVTPEAGDHTYLTGASAKITAEPAPGWKFSGWSGDAGGTANPLTVNMNTHKNITANFAVRTYTLTTGVTGSGSIARVPDQADYDYEDTVRLTAVPTPGWNFIGWSGDLTGSLNPV